jgi:sporulation protein YtfJ
MADHPILGLLSTSMHSIKEMVDVNTIIGDAINTPDGTVIIPVSKVSFGFASGGSDFSGKPGQSSESHPFGGGSGAGVSITPIAFLIVSGSNIRLMQISDHASTVDKIVEMVPDMFDKISSKFKSNGADSEDIKF